MSETIAAISTAMQKSGIAIVRISGDEALRVADRVFSGRKKPSEAETHRILYGKVLSSDGDVIDECLCTVMRAPNSYTKEDVVELNVHGGRISAQKTLEAVLRAGARQARGGEFTLRAFLNGRMDLSEAEAVADIIDSKTALAQTAAVNQLSGKLADGINRLRDGIIRVMSFISAATDFPDEDADSLAGFSVLEELRALKREVDGLLENADRGILLREGAICAICGKPNVGKSSLLNALSGEEKAIVTEIEGTTRDIIEEYVNIGGIPVRLADTAGIREQADTVEKIGVRRAIEYIGNADLCLFILDGSRPFDATDEEIFSLVKQKPYLAVINKCELTRRCTPPPEIKNILEISAKEKTGLDALQKKIGEMLLGGDFSADSVMITNERHKDACISAQADLERAIRTIGDGIGEDIASVYLESAAAHLGQITGKTVSDEVLDEVFSRFCIGK